VVLFESASGFALFEQKEGEEIGNLHDQVQAAVADMAKFGKLIKLKAFLPFESAEGALAACNDVSEGTFTS
jgi:nucleolar protein 56